MDHLSVNHDRALILIRHSPEEHPVGDHHLRLRSDALTFNRLVHGSIILERFADEWFVHPFTRILPVAKDDRLDACPKLFRQLLVQFFREIVRIQAQHFRERRQFILSGFQDLFKIALLEELADERGVGFCKISIFSFWLGEVIINVPVLTSYNDSAFRENLQFLLNILYCSSNQIVSVF